MHILIGGAWPYAKGSLHIEVKLDKTNKQWTKPYLIPKFTFYIMKVSYI